jgi:hypothetical protein
VHSSRVVSRAQIPDVSVALRGPPGLQQPESQAARGRQGVRGAGGTVVRPQRVLLPLESVLG